MFQQIKREASLTVLFLALLILFWIIAGFGFSGAKMQVFEVPLWAILGTVGVWFAAIILAYILTRKIKDVDL